MNLFLYVSSLFAHGLCCAMVLLLSDCVCSPLSPMWLYVLEKWTLFKKITYLNKSLFKNQKNVFENSQSNINLVSIIDESVFHKKSNYFRIEWVFAM